MLAGEGARMVFAGISLAMAEMALLMALCMPKNLSAARKPAN